MTLCGRRHCADVTTGRILRWIFFLSGGPNVIFSFLRKERDRKMRSREGDVVMEEARIRGDRWEGGGTKKGQEPRRQGLLEAEKRTEAARPLEP